MGRSRRTVTVAAALALAGCTSGRQRRDDGVGDDTDDATGGPAPGLDPSASGGEAPREWWATLPDLAVVNDGEDGVTAYVAIYGPDWLEPRFRRTVSLRAPVHGEPPARVAFVDVDVVGANGVLAVETADGRTAAHDWTGGDSRRGVVVHLFDDRVEFAVVAR
ncbi:hypothetical protein [Halorubellus sp. PRR65]|uniref:hypothetical protein n=1 Tax=Halorubellus sp. PRR65 TaxID=3098148 RepID=UPI002B2567CE|nr:hypothetical protein [Halorubellus sp. PRR65]